MTIRVPLSMTPCVVDVNSAFMALNGFTIGKSHFFVLNASWSAVRASDMLLYLLFGVFRIFEININKTEPSAVR